MKFRIKLTLITIGIFMCVQCTSNFLMIKGEKNRIDQKTEQKTELKQDSSIINLNKKY